MNQPVHEVAKRGHEDGQHDEVDPLHQVWQDDPPANYIGREGRGGEGRGGEGRGGRGGEGRGEKGRGEWRGGEGRGEEERGEWRGGEGRGEEGRGEGRGGEGRGGSVHNCSHSEQTTKNCAVSPVKPFLNTHSTFFHKRLRRDKGGREADVVDTSDSVRLRNSSP